MRNPTGSLSSRLDSNLIAVILSYSRAETSEFSFKKKLRCKRVSRFHYFSRVHDVLVSGKRWIFMLWSIANHKVCCGSSKMERFRALLEVGFQVYWRKDISLIFGDSDLYSQGTRSEGPNNCDER